MRLHYIAFTIHVVRIIASHTMCVCGCVDVDVCARARVCMHTRFYDYNSYKLGYYVISVML